MLVQMTAKTQEVHNPCDPLSDNIEVIQKTEGSPFRLDGMHQIASWCFTYRVENIS